MSGFRFSPEVRADAERQAEAFVLRLALRRGQSLTAEELHDAIEAHVRAAEIQAEDMLYGPGVESEITFDRRGLTETRS